MVCVESTKDRGFYSTIYESTFDRFSEACKEVS